MTSVYRQISIVIIFVRVQNARLGFGFSLNFNKANKANKANKMRRVDRQTNALPDQPTDISSYRGALPHLKNSA